MEPLSVLYIIQWFSLTPSLSDFNKISRGILGLKLTLLGPHKGPIFSMFYSLLSHQSRCPDYYSKLDVMMVQKRILPEQIRRIPTPSPHWLQWQTQFSAVLNRFPTCQVTIQTQNWQFLANLAKFCRLASNLLPFVHLAN